jgi:dipeptidase D
MAKRTPKSGTSCNIDTLSPKAVWRYFDRIRQIPHGSGNETALAEAVVAWAAKRGCPAETDAVGNVVVRIPPTKGHENVPTLVLQGHLDMVCEKHPDKIFDFEKDPITLVREGDWMTADGTTLGADNGIGLATALAFLDLEDVPHGPLEILATVEEETGLLGAQSVDSQLVKGRLLFNMDSEEDGIFYVGCAGGSDSEIVLPTRRVRTPKGLSPFLIRAGGLRGGHSGLDIIRNRANALVLLARVLFGFSKTTELRVSSVFGGDKHNAIPRDAEATILVPPEEAETITRLLDASLDGFRDEFAAEEPDLSLEIQQTPCPSSLLDVDSSTRLLRLMLGLPNGVLSMMRDIPQMVETSCNLAKVRTTEQEVMLSLSARSPVRSAMARVQEQIDAVSSLALAGATVKNAYPGWKPNMKSEMLARAKRIWEETHGEAPEIRVVHAGLECGLLAERFKDMDMISLGPTIESPHSPNERVSISSVARFFDFVTAFITSFTTD